MQIAAEHRLLTTKEVAIVLGLSVSTLAKRRLKGLPPHFHKLGRAVRYSWQAVQAFASETSRRSTSQKAQVL